VAERDIADVNARVWKRGDFVGEYTGDRLRKVEEVILDRYRDELGGRVLELGSGAGRVTRHLAKIADEVHALDVSPAMVEYARQAVPEAIFYVSDMRDLPFGPAAFDAVVAPYNVLDVLDDAGRRRELDSLHRIIGARGLLVVSTHNRGFVPRLRGPGVRFANPAKLAADLVRLPRRLRNRRELLPLERDEPGYAIINDSGHNYSLLHYYIARDDQERQLAEHGFELIECLDMEGNAVGPGEDAPEVSELHYVARRVET
jgi:SAM-dependent methyltransferase